MVLCAWGTLFPWLATEARKADSLSRWEQLIDPFNPYFPLLKSRPRGSWRSCEGPRHSGINHVMIRVERTPTDTNG